MSNLVIVAIPAEDDYIWKISSEKVPHMTLLFLGDLASVKNFSKIADFVQHATERSIHKFGVEVDHRGTLGADNADVLFFSTSKWSGIQDVKDYRSYLLQEPNIKTAYDSVEQFDGWTPHLTLGYPATPAKPDNRDYPGINFVQFDKIGIWFNDFDGLEFPLSTREYDYDMAVGMSEVANPNTNFIRDFISHHGVLGMRWGVRGGRGTPTAASVTQRGKKLRGTGGKGQPPHVDAIKARTLGQQAKKSGVQSLSNHELQQFALRLNLEQSAKRVAVADKPPVKRFVSNLLGQTAKTQVSNVANEAASAQVKKLLLKTAVVAA
jgi:2'-5' RNA ligase